MNRYAETNFDRILGDLIRYGRIDSVDFESMTATVDFDGYLVSGLEWAKSRAGDDRSGSAPSIGEQVCVLSPSGDITQGMIAFSISCDQFPPPNKNGNPKTIYVDGTWIEYNKESHTLTVDASNASGVVIVKCDRAEVTADTSILFDTPEGTFTGNLKVAQNVLVGGSLGVTGTSAMSGSVEFTGASVKHDGKEIGGSHTHKGIKSGTENSGDVN